MVSSYHFFDNFLCVKGRANEQCPTKSTKCFQIHVTTTNIRITMHFICVFERIGALLIAMKSKNIFRLWNERWLMIRFHFGRQQLNFWLREIAQNYYHFQIYYSLSTKWFFNKILLGQNHCNVHHHRLRDGNFLWIQFTFSQRRISIPFQWIWRVFHLRSTFGSSHSQCERSSWRVFFVCLRWWKQHFVGFVVVVCLISFQSASNLGPWNIINPLFLDLLPYFLLFSFELISAFCFFFVGWEKCKKVKRKMFKPFFCCFCVFHFDFVLCARVEMYLKSSVFYVDETTATQSKWKPLFRNC